MHMIHSEFVLRYTRKSTGICGQSNRPMLNGGLSPLRFDRKTVESKTAADLRIKSTGLTAANFLNTREVLFNIVDKVLGGNLEEKFKRRTDFVSLGDYDSYMMATLKPNMVVQLNRATQLPVPIGAIGRFVSFRNRARKLVLVKWPSGLEYVHVCHLNILTPPINMEIFSDE